MPTWPPRRIFPSRIFGRCAMGRERSGEALVRAGEIAQELPRAARPPRAGHQSAASLRGPRLLTRDLKTALTAKARELGFDLCRIARPDAAPQTSERLTAWLNAGYAGDMDYM